MLPVVCGSRGPVSSLAVVFSNLAAHPWQGACIPLQIGAESLPFAGCTTRSTLGHCSVPLLGGWCAPRSGGVSLFGSLPSASLSPSGYSRWEDDTYQTGPLRQPCRLRPAGRTVRA